MHGGGGAPGGQTGRYGKGRTRIASADEAAQRAENADAPKIPHLLRRISELFAPHKAALAVTVVLVLIGAALSVIPPLLTQRAFDDGLFPVDADGDVTGPNLSVLATIVGAMILVYIVSALLGVWQTWLTATIGNKVMGSLRVRLFTHLQSMELSFFTRTKTGVIQSRLQNDVGGVASVLTNTVSSVLGNTVTVISAFVAMLLLNWQLTVIAARADAVHGHRAAPGRPGAGAHRRQDAGVAVRDDGDHAGDPVGVGHPAVEELHAAAERDRPLRRREPEPDPAAGAAADDRPVVLRDGEHLHVVDPRDRLPRRRAG